MKSFLALPSSDLRTLPLLHVGFVVTGVFTVMLGPVLPLLAQRWGLTDSQTANFFTAQFGGLLLGVALSSYVLDRTYRPAFVSGFLLMGFGAATLGIGPWQMALPSLFCMGFGNGFITAATNLWVGEVMQEGKARALSFVNFSWTIGAVSCPFLFQYFASPRAFRQVLDAVCAVSVLVAAAFALSRVDRVQREANFSQKMKPENNSGFDRTAAMFSLLFFLYVGAETAVGGWVATYARRASVSSGAAWILTPAFFWAGMMVGRGLGTLALRHVPERPVMQTGSLLGFLGIAILTQMRTLHGIDSAAFSIGMGFSVIFPVLFAWMAGHYGGQTRFVTGRFLAVAELGAAGIPWLVGVVSAATASLRSGLAILLADLAIILALASLLPLPLAVAGARVVSEAQAEARR
jgi:MFS transporter, FHS family, glucose/mannose:H+ symporter